MKKSAYFRRFAFSGLAILLAALTGCGGGGTSTSSSFSPPPPLSITTSLLPDGTAGESYSATLRSSGGTGTITWSVTSGNLPGGLSLSSNTGAISGTPNASGSFSFTVQARDSSSPPQTASRDLSIQINAELGITTSTLPQGVEGPYSQTLQATGGSPPYTWALVSGLETLPPFLSLSDNGFLSGSLVKPGEFAFAAEVTDSESRTAQQSISLTVIEAVRITTDFVLPLASLNKPYSVILGASGGTGTLQTWTLESSSLPPGIQLNESTGEISGAPTSTGSFRFSVRLDDSGPPASFDAEQFGLEVVDQLTIFGTRMPDAVVDRPYSETLGVAGGEPPFSWRILEGATPNGLTLNASTGGISGTPTAIGGNSFRVEVTDSSTPPEITDSLVVLTVQPPIRIVTENPIDCVVEFSYNGAIEVEGGRSPMNVRITNGRLPPALIVFDQYDNRTIRVIGTCTEVASFTFDLEVTDSISPPTIDTKSLTIRVNSNLELTRIERLPEGLEDQPYSFALEATGGVLPYEWRVSRLPAGLAVGTSSGVISGIPEEPFDGTLGIQVLDSSNPRQGEFANPDLKITGLLEIVTTRLPSVKLGSPFRAIPAFKGGTPPLTWSLVSGSLPTGVALDPSTGEISGTPSAEGIYEFALRVTDSGTAFPQMDEQALALTVSTALGRNDSIPTAAPISNGTFQASISPYADPPRSAQPDTDYFELTATPGAVVTAEILAEQLLPPSPLDSVIEILAADGSRFNTCRDSGDDAVPPPLITDFTQVEFDDNCTNDDNRLVGTLDSLLEFLVPGTPGETVTFYVHVLDFRGNARPDFSYQIKISGAN